MFNVESVLPFLEKAPVIRNRRELVKKSDIFTLPEWSLVKSDNVGLNRIFSGILVKPMGFVVLNASVPVIMKLLRDGSDYFSVDLKEVDYQVVADLIEIETKDNGLKNALYPSGLYDSYEYQEIRFTTYIDYATLGKSMVDILGPSDLVSRQDRGVSEYVNEELTLDSFSSGTAVVQDDEESSMMIRLRSYFEGGYTTNRVPLLVGQSAVGKSAVIKALTQEYGYRLIDVRTAFMSRLDIEGLTQKVDLGDRIESFNCPMSDFVEATDAYIEYCESVIPVIEQEILKETDQDRVKNLTFVLQRFKEGAKTPVLLFDEITRGEGSVRQALTKILTDKEFMGYSMKRARVIAATNAVIDDSGLPEDLFLTKDIDDVAFFDRFESIPVSINSAYGGWVKWARMSSSKYQGTNIHADIIDYCTSMEKCYDMSPVYDVYESTGDMNEVTTAVYPNFRTWERVSDYLYSLQSKVISEQVISSLIGVKAAKEVVKWLEAKGYFLSKDSGDFLTDAVNHGLDSNIPTLLISPSSMGKTSRIKKAVEDRGYTFIQVNLGQQDRLDLSGPPVKVDINRFILDKKIAVSKDLKEKLLAELEKSALPKLVTMRAPKSDLVKKFKEAQEMGGKVVLFYDELNRVQNPSVMSSVFEAISDHKAFGINFNPDNVCVFAACNLGDNMGDASQLDPAIANRFAVYWKKQHTKEDAESFIEYAKSSGMSKNIIAWLEGMGTDKLLLVISSIDSRTIEMSAASTRGIEDLDKFLKDTKNNSIMSGSVINGDGSAMSVLANWSTNKKSVDKVLAVMDLVNSYISNWSALRGKGTYVVGGQVVSAKELVGLFKSLYSGHRNDDSYIRKNLGAINNLLETINKIDAGVRKKREECVKLFLGYNARDFVDYYNQVSGRELEEIKIEDIVDISLVSKYVDQVFRGYSRISDIDRAGVKVISEVFDFYNRSLPVQNCRVLIDSIISKLPSSDSILNFIKTVSSDIGGKDVIFEVAENGEEAYAKGILNKVGKREVVKSKGVKPKILR